MPEISLGLKRDADGRYPVHQDGVVVGHVFRDRTYWYGQLVGDGDRFPRFGQRTRNDAYQAVARALSRGGNRIVKLQPAPRIDNVVDGQELTQLPYPLHVRSHDGKVLEDWADRVIGFTRDLSEQQIDLWWHDLVSSDPSWAIGMYVVIQNPGGGYATLDTAVRDVEVSL